MARTPKRAPTRAAASRAHAAAAAEGGGAARAEPVSSARPESVQPIVPFSSAATRFGTPASISDCAPMIERVRPAQFTTTSVSGSGARSRTRRASSAPGTHIPPGMFMRRYSASGRLSRTTCFLPAARSAASSSAVRRGVPHSASTNSPNALLGT